MVYSDICISLHFCTSITEEKGLGGGSGYSFTHLYTNKVYLVWGTLSYFVLALKGLLVEKWSVKEENPPEISVPKSKYILSKGT